MNTRQVLETYDDDYAQTYNERFLLNERSKIAFDREIRIVKELLPGVGKWLDVACGTGCLLSQFPGVPRAGLDISPVMLELARQANRDALFFREGDFKAAVPEWDGQWSLVTCMWYAYCLVESMAEVRDLIRNLAAWTSDTGACFVPVWEPRNLSKHIRTPYVVPDRFYGGNVLITGVMWTWIEESGKRHDNMVAPHIDHMVAMFKEYFDVVEVMQYPLSRHRWGPRRKAILATSKKPHP
jgi:SAM-dependent methyltransferase